MIAGVYCVFMAGHVIDVPGLQYDEVLFVNAATGEPTNGLFVAKRILGVPVMLMGYIGALKAYLYHPVFALFGVSPATIRWPVIGLSLVTVWLTYAVARFSFGRIPSALLSAAVAVDPVFIYMTKLDYGPVALMLMLKLLALWFVLRSIRRGSSMDLWGGCLACALGLFDKLNFIWFIIALGIACTALFRGELGRLYRRNPRGAIAPLAVLAIVIVAATARLIVPQLLAAPHTHSLAERVPYVAQLYTRTMNGQAFYRFVTGSELGTRSLANLATGAALLVLGVMAAVAAWRSRGFPRLHLRHRILALHFLLFLLIGLQVWITTQAWGPHHVMMLYPLQYFLVFGAATTVAGTFGVALAALVLIGSGVAVGRAYDDALRPGMEFQAQWSPLIHDLVRYVENEHPERVISVDWGIHNQLYALGTPALRAAVRDRWPRFRKPATPEVQSRLAAEDTVGRVLAILHGPGEDIFPSVRPNFFAWATSAGVVPVLRRTFISPAGTRVFEVYSLEPKGSKATPAR